MVKYPKLKQHKGEEGVYVRFAKWISDDKHHWDYFRLGKVLNHYFWTMRMNPPVIKAPLLFAKNWRGFATPFFIVVKYRDPKLEAHEQCHVRQWWRGWIIGFAVLYVYYLIKYGYRNNPYEIEARQAERL